MCCFSGSVRYVSSTRLFARFSGRGTQFLVYSMSYAADRDLAMILPLPVAWPARENYVRFLNLKNYPTFFEDMDAGFPQLPPLGAAGISGAAGGAPTLRVHEVGNFVASFVPTLDDFRRLDARFKLPRKTWDKIPAYRDFGFAVFQLKKSTAEIVVHPMALEFATRMTHSLFLPTVHIHDGQVHPRERFDHELYVQDYRLRPTPPRTPAEHFLLPSRSVTNSFMDTARTQGIVSPNEIAYKRTLIGEFPNQDTLIRCG